MNGESLDINQTRLQKLKEIFPELFAENQLDWEKLKAAFGEDINFVIEFFFKLPFWFRINTPIGTYNPDWAIVFKGEKKICFVAETKSEGQELRGSEELKIKCGTEHFKKLEDVVYKRVSSVADLHR